MLATQVQYWQYKELSRHNLVAEDQGQQTINESVRHNKVSESQGQQTINETIRHNKKSEAQTDFYNTEMKRHNLKTERQTDFVNAEMKRHNLASEGIGRTQAYASVLGARAAQTSAAAAMQNARTNAYLAPAQYAASKASARYSNKKAKAVKHDVIQGYINSGARIGNIVSSFRGKKK